MKKSSSAKPEEQLPPPHEKLLRPPTFWEKYGGRLKVLAVLLFLTVVLFSISSLFITPENTNQSLTANTVTPTALPLSSGDQQTAAWQTYTDEQLKISFKYPAGWEVKTKKQSPVTATYKMGPKGEPPQMYGYLFTQGTNAYIQKNYLSKYIKSFSSNESKVSEYRVRTYALKYRRKASAFGPTKRDLYVIENTNNQKFLFDSYGSPNELFSQVTSSFKFID